jgi:hypothetical protein
MLNFLHSPNYIALNPVQFRLKNSRVRSGEVAKFDYENAKDNLKHYGDENAPLYDLSKVNVDMHLFWSAQDWVADNTDLHEYLFQTLPKEYVKVGF